MCIVTGNIQIDALCIDQDNLLERNHQGLADGTDFLQGIEGYYLAWTTTLSVQPLLSCMHKRSVFDLSSEERDAPGRYVVCNRCRTRARVTQEIRLSRQALCWPDPVLTHFNHLCYILP